MKTFLPALATSITLALCPVWAQDRQHGAHEHGVSDLDIAQENGIIEISINGAADNFLGFEHAPRDQAQRSEAQRVMALLQRPDTLFKLPADAQCVAKAANVSSPVFDALGESATNKHEHGSDHAHDEGHEHKHGKDHGHDESHSHDHSRDHRHAHGETHAHKHDKDHAHHESHSHDHSRDHSHGHDHEHADGEKHEHHAGHSHDHANVQASWRFECASPQHLNSIEVAMIEAFPRHQSIRTAVISDAGPAALVITTARSSIPLKR